MRVEIIYKLVTQELFSTFVFLIVLWKAGTSWISRMGRILEKGGLPTMTKWHETCKCKCRLDANVCNNKQHWNDDKCWCECKELIDKGACDKNCKCRKKVGR